MVRRFSGKSGIRTIFILCLVSTAAAAACSDDDECASNATCGTSTLPENDAGDAARPFAPNGDASDASPPDAGEDVAIPDVPHLVIHVPAGPNYVIQGVNAQIPITIERLGGLVGEVVLRFDNVPAEVTIPPVIFPAAETSASVSVQVTSARPQGAIDSIVVSPTGRDAGSEGVPFPIYVRGPSGSVDTSFGSGNVDGTFDVRFAHAIRLLDGKTVAVTAEGTAKCRVVRFLPNGALDATFGDKGIAPTTVAASGAGQATVPHLSVDSKGRIIVQGDVIVRLTADGKPDPTWAGGGSVAVSVGGGNAAGIFAAAAIGPNDSVYAVDACLKAGTCKTIRVVRLDAAGLIDSSFNPPLGSRAIFTDATAGLAALDVPEQRFAVGGDGRFSYVYQVTSTPRHSEVVRSALDGKTQQVPPASLGLLGFAPVLGPGGNDTVMYAHQDDGSPRHVVVQRLTSTLAVDTGFTGATGWDGVVTSIAALADGKVVATGIENGKGLVVARYLSTGAPDTTFSATGRINYTDVGNVNAYVQADGSVVAVGQTTLSDAGTGSSIVHIWQ